MQAGCESGVTRYTLHALAGMWNVAQGVSACTARHFQHDYYRRTLSKDSLHLNHTQEYLPFHWTVFNGKLRGIPYLKIYSSFWDFFLYLLSFFPADTTCLFKKSSYSFMLAD